MISGRRCALRRLHVPIRQLCELFGHDERLFLLQFQHPLYELDAVVQQLEMHRDLGLIDLFSLFDGQGRFVAHFRIDRFPPDTGLLGFHGGSFVASPDLGRVFLEGSLLLLEATLASYGWTHVLSNCLVTNLATAHFLSGLGFELGYVARRQRVVDGHPVDVAYFSLTRSAHLVNRLRKRLIGDRSVVPLPDCPGSRPTHSTMHSVDPSDSAQHVAVSSCRRALEEFLMTEAGARLRFIDEPNVAHFLGPVIAEILAHWKRYTGMDGHPEGLDEVVAAWGSYTRLMSLLPVCVLDQAGGRPVAFFLLRLFPGNHSLAEIAGSGLDGADVATFAVPVRSLLDHLLRRTAVCRIQASGCIATALWHLHLGFTREGRDHEGNAVYSLVRGDDD